MNSLQLDLGGRPVANDDFQVLQDRDAALGLPALLTGLGPCVVSGCRVYPTGSVWNVGPGTVWDGAQLLDFPGRGNAALPAMFAPGAVVAVDERAYQTGGTKTTIRGQRMDLVPVDPALPGALVVDETGALTFWHRVQERTRTVGEFQDVGTRAYAAADYDATGRGKRGSAAWGWALANGQNDTDDRRQRFAVGLDPAAADYDAPGKTGGEARHTLALTEMPAHNHTGGVPQARFAYLDGKVTLNSNTDDSPTEPNLGRTAAVQTQGGGQPHENRPPFYVTVVRQWVGF